MLNAVKKTVVSVTVAGTFFHIKDPQGTWIEFAESHGEPAQS